MQQQRANEFSLSLIRASKEMGSLLHVAMHLNVDPRQLYLWVAGVERPSDEQIGELEIRLRSVKTAPRNH